MKSFIKYLPLLLLFMAACDNLPEGSLVKQDLVVGTGALGEKGKTWQVHYIGRLKGKAQIDSTVFESTRTDNKPFSFVFDGSLSPDGFELGIDSMKVGGKRRIIIPAHLGFGKTGIKNRDGSWLVKPNQDIVYEVELLSLPQLQTTDTTVGTGTLVETGKLITVNYTGRIKGEAVPFNDNVIGYSFRTGQGQLIEGFEQGISGMRVGGTRKVIIPPHLGYKSLGAGYNQSTGRYTVPPHATLEFDITITKVE
jgi:peptidylprolyl isomerase